MPPMLDPRTTAFFAHFLRTYPRRSALMVTLLILSGIAEGIGVATLLPVLEVAVGGAAAEPSGISRAMADLLGVFGLSPTLGVLLVLIVVAISLKGAFRWLAMKEVGYAVAQSATDLRLRLIRALMEARWSYFASQPIGHFANALGREAVAAAQAYKQACSALAMLIQIGIYLALVVLVSWQVAVLAVVIGAGVAFVLRGFIHMARRAGNDQTRVLKSLLRRLTEALPGIKPVKAMGKEEFLLPLLEEEAEDLNRAQQRQVLAVESLRSFQEPILVFFIAVGLFGALTWGDVPFSIMLIVVFLFFRVIQRVNSLQSQYQDIATGESAFWSMNGLLQEAEASREVATGGRTPPPLERGVYLRGVDFSYGDTPVLRNVDVEVPSGGFVALIGPSGAGKTTLVDLVTGLHRPDSGEVYLDDLPLGDVDLKLWRKLIGYVPQETILFNASIYRNVTLGDEAIGRDDVRRAVEDAGLWQFVSSLPDGMDHVIGEMGTKLSGGQRQRISIARALVNRPLLLILDEATTALDPATEAAICETLRALRGQVTVLAISHQSALRDAADVVYEVAHGRVQRARGAPASV